jgi:hypothetical protein
MSVALSAIHHTLLIFEKSASNFFLGPAAYCRRSLQISASLQYEDTVTSGIMRLSPAKAHQPFSGENPYESFIPRDFALPEAARA